MKAIIIARVSTSKHGKETPMKVVVKAIDMLGEKVLVTKEV